MKAQVETLKNEGNDFFKDKKYSEAKAKFKEALSLIESKGKPSDNKTEQNKLYINLLTNASLCCLNMKQPAEYESAISFATDALALDPENLKALYRRGIAYKQLGELRENQNGPSPLLIEFYTKAKDDLEKLTLLDRKNTVAEEKLKETINNFARIKLLVRQEEEETKKTVITKKQEAAKTEAKVSAAKSSQTMEKILKDYKVAEVTKIAHEKVENQLMQNALPTTRTDLEKSVKILQKTKQSLNKFIMRFPQGYLANLNPSFDLLYKIIINVCETGGEKSTSSNLAFKNIVECKSFTLLWKSLTGKEKQLIVSKSKERVDAEVFEELQKVMV